MVRPAIITACYSLWTCDNDALFDFPLLELAFDGGLEPGRERLLDLMLITQLVTFYYRSLIRIREQRCEPLDIVVWLL